MAKSKDTIIKLLTSNGKTLEVSIDHAEKILFSRNNVAVYGCIIAV